MIIEFWNEIHKLKITTEDNFTFSFDADSVVRNELNGRRPKPDKDPRAEVIFAMTHDKYNKYPVMPRPFPKGVWEILDPLDRHGNEYLAPFFMPTTAEQWLNVWELDQNGGYRKETDKKVLDMGYGIHFSTSPTTVGCIRVYQESDLFVLKNMVVEVREHGERAWIRVG